MGCGVELMYVCVLVFAARDLATDRLANVMVFVATAPQLVETGAFLLFVAYLGQSLEEFQHAGDLERILDKRHGTKNKPPRQYSHDQGCNSMIYRNATISRG